MATTTAYDIAGEFLRSLGAPDTPEMRRAVAIWLRYESGGSVTGNNPWNLHVGSACTSSSGFCPGSSSLYQGYIGNRYAGSGDKNVAVFSDIKSGTDAAAQNLQRLAGVPTYGYNDVIKQARLGNPVGFLTALQNSSWSAGHYGHSKLVSAYKGNSSGNFSVTLKSVGGSSGSDTSISGPTLGAWGDLIKFPVGHVLTVEDINSMMKVLQDNGFFAGDSILGGSKAKTYEILLGHVGDTWTKNLQDQIQGEFGTAASNATDPITAVGAAIGDVGNQIADTGTWIAFIVLGVVLIGGGIFLLKPSGPEGAVSA